MHALRDVSLRITQGEYLAIRGPSGCGKSTLLHILGCVDTPSSGTLRFDGRDVGSLPDGARSDLRLRSIGFVFQQFQLLPNTTALENVMAPLLYQGISPKQAKKSATDILVKLGLGERLNFDRNRLSGGQQQRVAIARALVTGPDIVLADEPTQGVDVGARSELYQILRKISSEGIPVVVSSSDSKELEGLCDIVYVMSRGQIVDVLEGSSIREERMVDAAISSTTQAIRIERQVRKVAMAGNRSILSRVKSFLEGDYAPTALLVSVMALLGSYILSINDKYLSDFNVSSVLLLATALGFIALGQTVAMMTGGIDLAAGPLAGLLVVVSSFFFLKESSMTSMMLGLLAMVAVSVAVGLLNGSLIRYLKFTAIAATLTTYIGLGGVSFLLRSAPDGYINTDVTSLITTKFGPLPAVFALLVIVVMLAVFKNQFPTSAATWFIAALVVFMAGSIQFYARWRRLRAERLATGS